MPVEYFFPKAFYFQDALISEEANAQLVAAAHSLRREFPVSTRSNLYTTYGSVPDIFAREAFGALHEALVAQIHAYLELLETRPGNRFAITDSWVSISAPGNFERMHTHDGSYISGVYYIQTAPGCGDLLFEELSDNLWASARTKAVNFNAISYTPVDRRLILFNSKVPHAVGQNVSSTERIALSFNAVIV
ncbi:MAG: hypothetical protein EOO11_19315 [Chitinophagaceae bacterium]|nr:MAG: hypothetical protein EOO11_19315 [Chitinophagaceae bacterium]